MKWPWTGGHRAEAKAVPRASRVQSVVCPQCKHDEFTFALTAYRMELRQDFVLTRRTRAEIICSACSTEYTVRLDNKAKFTMVPKPKEVEEKKESADYSFDVQQAVQQYQRGLVG